MPTQPHVLVVGAGIIGASIAYHLVRDGARVTLVDAGSGGGIATRYSWAWINASWGNAEPYFRLRTRSFREWNRLASEVPAVGLRWPGGLLWDIGPEALPAYVAEHAGWGYDIRLVARDEALRLEPHLSPQSVPAMAAYAASEGVVEPEEAARALIRAAEARGATFRHGVTVRNLHRVGERITGIATDQGPIGADHVVLAVGAATTAIAATAGIEVPTSAPPGLLVVTQPMPKLLNGLVMATELHVRQRPDGRLIAGSDFGGSDPGSEAEKAAADAMTAMRALMKRELDLRLDHFTVGYRPMLPDDLPAVGTMPGAGNLYIAVTHSGITLAPALGLFAAAEILRGERDPLLSPYAAARFARP